MTSISNFIKLLAFCLIFEIPAALSADISQGHEEKTLSTVLKVLPERIKEAHAAADDKLLREAYHQFTKLNYPAEKWQEVITALNITKWPLQNDMQAVGGHLFYPPDAHDLEDHDYTQPRLQTRDMIWAFAIAAHNHHPVGQFYLARAFNEIRKKNGEEEEDCSSPFVKNLYQKSLATLEKCCPHPDASYILGLAHSRFSLEEGIGVPSDILKALEYHEEASSKYPENYRNQLRALKLKSIYKGVFEKSPPIEDYIKLAEKGYAPAYIEAARLEEEDNNNALSLYKKALDLKYDYTLIYFGGLYQYSGNVKAAFKFYYEAAQRGLSNGYFSIVQMIAGFSVKDYLYKTLRALKKDLPESKREDLKEDISVVEEYLKKASDMHDIEALNELGEFYEVLYKSTKSSGSSEAPAYLSRLKDALKSGMKIGSPSAYEIARKYFPDEYGQLVALCGPNPYQDLEKEIEIFLSSRPQ